MAVQTRPANTGIGGYEIIKHIVVQAGGKGTRLKRLTKNKPKALVPVDNLPMLFHLFRKYPDKHFIIIADYHSDVMQTYLKAFATNVAWEVIKAQGTGTCAGVEQALTRIPETEPFMLVWSDLILSDDLKLPDAYEKTEGKPKADYIGLSVTFPCRWKYENGVFSEESSKSCGVAGFFLFTGKDKLKDVPESGELVRWMQEQQFQPEILSLEGTREFGLADEYEMLEKVKCRPFNRIRFEGNTLVKEAISEQGKALADRECAWYEKALALHVDCIPAIYATNPLRMERIMGKNIYEADLTESEKHIVLEKLVDALERLHKTEQAPPDYASIRDAYYEKTLRRLEKVEQLVPYATDPFIVVNGRTCRNVFFHQQEFEHALNLLQCDTFVFLHGDCTFSNLMLRENGEPVLIDPRGYFGLTDFYGDVRYDWAKMYYSVVGNYDRFNLKDFDLDIGGDRGSLGATAKNLPEGEVRLDIVSNGWESLEDDFFALTKTVPEEIKLIHAVIWLSLTTYAWEDYDSVCGAFYNGLYYLEEVL